MKRNILLTAIALLFTTLLLCQEITEVELAFKKNINNFWTAKKSALVIELHHQFSIPFTPAADTIRRVFIQIQNEGFETVGMSSGISLFSTGRFFGSGVSANKIEKVVKEKEFAYLDKEQFIKMHAGMSSIYKYLKTIQIGDMNTKPFIAVYEDENIKFGGSLKPSSSDADRYEYYFKYNDAVFKMSDADFIEIAKFMNQVRDSLNKSTDSNVKKTTP